MLDLGEEESKIEWFIASSGSYGIEIAYGSYSYFLFITY